MAKLEHSEIIARFQEAWEADRDNREEAYDDLRFLAGDQWDSRARSEREMFRRPIVTVNKMGQFVRQVTGDMRLNPTSINVTPVDDGADVEKAEIFEGIIRQIEASSNATSVYAHAFECEAGIGIGHFRIKTRYAEGSVEEQEIGIERILNPLAVLWDPGAIELDRSDADYCFVSDMMPERKFKKKYPNASLTSFPNDLAQTGIFWRQGDFVRVAEFWFREPVERTLALTNEGETIDITGLSKEDRKFINIATDEQGKPRQRKFTDYKIVQYIVSGSETLSGPNEWAGRFIPIIPAIGSEIPLDETTVRHGIIRYAKDPQRLYNFYRSSQAELIGQQPRAPFLVTPNMIKGYESLWNTAATNPRPYLLYTPDQQAPGNRPVREQPPAASQALWQEAAIASDDMKAVTGIYDASLGAKSNETSGRAILARQREGDVGSYHYFDNFKAAIKRAGDILIDLIPKIYDTERVVRIIGTESEDPKFVKVNQEIPGLYETMNDLSVGKFDIRVSSGPSFSTQREESRESMLAATQANPMLWQVAGDLLIEAMDWPKAKEIAERLRRTMPPQLLSDEPPQAQPPDPMQEMASRLQAAGLEADVSKRQGEAEAVHLDNQIKAAMPAGMPVMPGRPVA